MSDVSVPVAAFEAMQEELHRLRLALPFLKAVRDALDADHTNMVACTVGDLGVEHARTIRKVVELLP